MFDYSLSDDKQKKNSYSNRTILMYIIYNFGIIISNKDASLCLWDPCRACLSRREKKIFFYVPYLYR